MPATVDRAVWEKVVERRAGLRWDSVAEKVWKDIGGNQEEMMPPDKFGRYTAGVEERIDRGRLSLRNKVKSEKHSEIYGGSNGGV